MFKKAGSVLFLAMLMNLTTVARASAVSIPLPLDNSWIVLDDGITGANPYFTGTGTGAATATTEWTWDSLDPVLFRITDYFVVGDEFEVFDNGTSVGTVTTPSEWFTVPGCANDPLDPSCGWTPALDAFSSPYFARATFLFAPGSHAISIKTTAIPLTLGLQSPFPDSTVAFSAAPAPVPEPTSLVLLGTGLLGLATRARARRRRQDQR